MRITQGDRGFAPECLIIAEELPEYFNEPGLEAMEADLQKDTLYVAVDGVALGFITIEQKNSAVAEISWMAVRRSRQGQGVGSALVERVARDLALKGTKILMVKTLAETVDYYPYQLTRNFYERAGFIHLETIDPYPQWGDENPCMIYVKLL